MKKLSILFAIALILTSPFYAEALSVVWDRYVTNGLRTLYTGDKVLIGARATTTNATLEVNGETASGYFTATTTTASTLPYASSAPRPG